MVSIDGFGDFSSAAWGMGSGSDLSVDGRVYFPHSLGIFYQALTQYLGFPHYGDEYKVMGLAPYGQPDLPGCDAEDRASEAGWNVRARSHLFPPSQGADALQWENGTPEFGDLFSPALEDLLGPRASPTSRSRIATATSRARCRRCTKRRSFICSRAAQTRSRPDRSCVRRWLRDEFGRQRQGEANDAVPAGLCASRQPAMQGGRSARLSRSGTSLAAARSFVMDHAYWGPQLRADEIARLARGAPGARLLQPAALSRNIADES